MSTVDITVDGVWGPQGSSSPYFAPNAPFVMNFDIPQQITVLSLSTAGTTDITNFSYLLNGQAIGANPTNIVFYNEENTGLFNLYLASGTTFVLTGNDAGSKGQVIPGIYEAAVLLPASGRATVDIAVTPVPATLPLFIGGLLLLAWFAKRSFIKAT
jgi:hypothetical protein